MRRTGAGDRGGGDDRGGRQIEIATSLVPTRAPPDGHWGTQWAPCLKSTGVGRAPGELVRPGLIALCTWALPRTTDSIVYRAPGIGPGYMEG